MTEPAPDPPKPKRKGCLRPGCIVPLLLLAGTCGWAVFRITLPGRLAAITHGRIHPGASLRDVMAVSEMYFDVIGSQCSGGLESFTVLTAGLAPSGSLTIRRASAKGPDDQEYIHFDGKPALLRFFDERAELRTCRRLGFTFLVTGVPPRTSFAVELGEDGKVVRVTEPHSWD